MTDAEIEDFLREMFEENYELLLADGGHALSPEVKNAALSQVLFYWRKLKGIATKVTDTEVLLVLPDQKSPAGRKYTIEGVVDIVQEANRTVMYDLKTHDADYVQNNLALYEDQLNVYAHIWQALRGLPLHETAIIATSYPLSVKRALQPPVDQAKLDKALANWQPVVPIPFDKKKVKATIKKFGKTVDDIENHMFGPCTVAKLKDKTGGSRAFGQDVCGNCDGRFSCSAYREYARASGHRQEAQLRAFMEQVDERDRAERLDASIPAGDARFRWKPEYKRLVSRFLKQHFGGAQGLTSTFPWMETHSEENGYSDAIDTRVSAKNRTEYRGLERFAIQYFATAQYEYAYQHWLMAACWRREDMLSNSAEDEVGQKGVEYCIKHALYNNALDQWQQNRGTENVPEPEQFDISDLDIQQKEEQGLLQIEEHSKRNQN